MPGPLEAPQDAALGSLSGPYIWLRDKVISFFNANEDVFQRLLGSDARWGCRVSWPKYVNLAIDRDGLLVA